MAQISAYRAATALALMTISKLPETKLGGLTALAAAAGVIALAPEGASELLKGAYLGAGTATGVGVLYGELGLRPIAEKVARQPVDSFFWAVRK